MTSAYHNSFRKQDDTQVTYLVVPCMLCLPVIKNLTDRQTGAEIAVLKSKISPMRNGILLPKLFWPTVRKNCSSDREKLLKFEAEGREFPKFWDH